MKISYYNEVEGLDSEISFEAMTFPAGEVHIKLKDFVISEFGKIRIETRIKNGNDLMELLLATDALRRTFKGHSISLTLPYIPFSRQDRPMIPGEPFSLKVFANLINSQNYEEVRCLDPHSDVSAALIDNLVISEPVYLLEVNRDLIKKYGDFTLIAPDGGALKKIFKHASIMSYEGEILCATKIRDLKTGKILRTEVECGDEKIKNKNIVILDDVASYAGTFMALAKVLKEKDAASVTLVVSHYEGVADLTKMKESGIDKIYTTNSMGDIPGTFRGDGFLCSYNY